MTKTFKRIADRLVNSPRRLWGISFLLFVVLGSAWSLSTPMGGSPDEYAHLVRAAAVARGQVNGTEVMVKHQVAGMDGQFAETGVQLPEWYRELSTRHSCYAFQQWQSADCAPALGSSEKTVEVTTAAGRYNPLYYAVVGWPSLLVSGELGLYLMRLVSAMFCAGLLASAVVAAAEWRRRGIMIAGLLAALTPTTLYMGGMVNPSGPEIAAGVLVWSAALPMFMTPDRALLNRRLLRLGIGGLVLINIRPLGLVWFAGAVVCALLLAQRSAVRMVVRTRATWLWGLLLLAGTGVAMAWAMAHPDHSVIQIPDWFTPLNAARRTFDNSLVYIHQMIGDFGWLDTPAPAITWLLWPAAVILLILLALCFGRPRQAFVVLAIMVALVLVPVAAQASQATKIGMVWQGRYLLPFMVGLPMAAAAVAALRVPSGGLPWRRLIGWMALTLTVANVAAFVWTLRRNTVGTAGAFFIHPAHWSPPGSWLLWLLAYGLGATGLAVIALAGDRAPSATAPAPHPPVDGERVLRRADDRRATPVG
ncbi:DUF2142 domain-containing protein [Kitasatospora purpeofusca]|uniref:DUF2142 domain-containing protein n=1 Tax=Kitasatospora purpeofusca TaxID=67352 RepID=UPI002A5A7DFF|nr:DUF2142 domain-containing protein [Kitasatospora purpeofusca]MDY0815399.1 DUF2142 domain-containing protein [Kitasatospora purpeofusca]